MVGACSKSQYVDLAGRTTLLSHQALVVRAPVPLLRVGSVNQLCLQILPDDSLSAFHPEWAIRRSDGVAVTVAAALLHADNSVDTISSVGYSGMDCLTIGPTIHETLHPPFAGARIWVTDSLTVSKISWASWNAW